MDKEDGEREGPSTLQHFVDHDAIGEGASDPDERPETGPGQHETTPVGADMGKGDDVSPERDGLRCVDITVWVVLASQRITVGKSLFWPQIQLELVPRRLVYADAPLVPVHLESTSVHAWRGISPLGYRLESP